MRLLLTPKPLAEKETREVVTENLAENLALDQNLIRKLSISAE
jgi:hypothetical protein